MTQQMKPGVSVKVIGSLIILTAIIIALGMFTQKKLYIDSTNLGSAIEEIQNCAREGKWDRAAAILDQVVKDWGKIKKTWSSLIDHQEIDNIDVTLSRLRPLLEARDTSSALSEASALSRYIKHIPEREKLSIDNLL